MKQHGQFKIWIEGHILFAELTGSWNGETTRAFKQAFIENALELPTGHWGHIVYLDDWALGTPEMEPIVQQLTSWCIVNGLTRAAQVFSPSMIKRFQLNKMVVEKQDDFIRRQFKDEKSALQWMSQEGFVVNKSLTHFG